jgi:hypothetical protein
MLIFFHHPHFSVFYSYYQTFMITLQRIHYDSQNQKSVKLNDFVRFRRMLNMRPYMSTRVTEDVEATPSDYQYELTGVILHSGVQAGGHYISFVKNAEGDWHEFNDKKVTVFDPNDRSNGFFARGFGGINSKGEERDENAYTLRYRQCPTTTKISDLLEITDPAPEPNANCKQDDKKIQVIEVSKSARSQRGFKVSEDKPKGIFTVSSCSLCRRAHFVVVLTLLSCPLLTILT